MTTLYFVRHCQPNYHNLDDMNRELTAKGLADRPKVTAFFEDKSIDVVLSSPYKRAVDTVAEFAEKKGLPIGLVPDFRERKVTDGWLQMDFTTYSHNQWMDFDYRLPGGECLREVQARNVAAIDRVLDQYPGKNILIGSHGTAMCTIYNYYDPSFGYDQFLIVKVHKPWVMRFTFDGKTCVDIQSYDPLV